MQVYPLADTAFPQAEIGSRRGRLDGLLGELTTAHEEANQARQALAAAQESFASEKRTLEAAIADLGGLEERTRVEQDDARLESQRLVRLAEEAQAKYQAELVAHADDVRDLSSTKEQLEQARSEAREAIKVRETAEANLSSSQASWETQKATLSQEMDDVRAQ